MDLKQFLTEHKELLVAPAVSDGFLARLVEQEGYPLIFGSGLNAAAALGYPDIGIVTLSEMLTFAETLVRNTRCPVIMDGDTGHGSYTTLRRMTEEFLKLGVAGMQLEDQVYPKRCGYFSGKQVAPMHTMSQRLRVAKSAIGDAPFYLIARTDSLAVEKFDRVLERLSAYSAEGADAILVEGATLSQLKIVRQTLPKVDLIVNVVDSGSRSPRWDQLEEIGVKMVLYSTRVLLSCLHAARQALQEMQQLRGKPTQIPSASFNSLQDLLDTQSYLEHEEQNHIEENAKTYASFSIY